MIPTTKEITGTKLPEPVARQMIAVCNALARLADSMERLDHALPKEENGSATASHA